MPDITDDAVRVAAVLLAEQYDKPVLDASEFTLRAERIVGAIAPLLGRRTLQVGDILYGFCQGAFGRDYFGDKTVEAIGPDWVVAREDPYVLCYRGDPDDLLKYTTAKD